MDKTFRFYRKNLGIRIPPGVLCIGVSQLVESLIWNQVVVRSSRITYMLRRIVGKTVGFIPLQRGFNSLLRAQALVAQLVEATPLEGVQWPFESVQGHYILR